MKVSDLILDLQEFHEVYGDLEVMVRVEQRYTLAAGLSGSLRKVLARPAVTKGTIITSRPEDDVICVVEL